AHAVDRERTNLVQNGTRRAAVFRTAGIGYDAEGAELVAAFLYRHESGMAAPAGRGRQVVELGFGWKIGFDHRLAPTGAFHHVGQTMVGLRAEDDVDEGGAGADLGALGLRNAAANSDQPPLGTTRCAQPPQIGIDLFGCLLPDVA